MLHRSSAAVALAAAALAAVAAPVHAKSRTFEFTYQAEVAEIPAGSRSLDVWVPFPQSDRVQTVHEVQITSPYVTSIARDPEYGNSMLYLHVDNPVPTGVGLTMKFKVTRFEDAPGQGYRTAGMETAPAAPKAGDPLLKRFLMQDKLVPLDAQVRQRAGAVVAGHGDAKGKARAIYDHAVGTMKYDKSGTGWGRGDIHFACDAMRGNCTDFHAVFTGFCRAEEVPSRFEIGFPIPAQRGEGAVGGYHCWARFYNEGEGWVPVDASEASKNPAMKEYFFGTLDENRVLFSQGRDIVLNPPQRGEPLNFFIYPYAEVDGKTHAGVKKTFAYRDLADANATASN